MRDLDPGASALAYFGSELRRHRLAAGMSQGGLGQQCYVSASLVGMFEKAQRVPSRDFMRRADEALDVDVFTHMWRLVSRESHPSFFRPFAEYEQEATLLREFEPLAVPGLLQTVDYARALLARRPDTSRHQLEELVAARMDRQAVLDRDGSPMLVVLVDESVLSRTVGSREIMCSQLEVLTDACQRARVVVQLVPAASGAAAGLAGAFTIASLDGAEVAYFETAATGQVVDRSEEVAACVAYFESLRGEALSREASLELIRKWRESYEVA